MLSCLSDEPGTWKLSSAQLVNCEPMHIVSTAMFFAFCALNFFLPLALLVSFLRLSSLLSRAEVDGEEVEPCWVVVDHVSSPAVGQRLQWVEDIL